MYDTWEALVAAAPGKVYEWMCVPESQELFRIAREQRAGARVLEIGVFGGANLSLFAMVVPDAEVIGVDPWVDDATEAYCRANLERNGVHDRVQLVGLSSREVGPHWATPLDVCIIDGDHSRAGARADIDDFAQWVVPGGTLALDDYWSFTGVREAFDDWWGLGLPEWEIVWGMHERPVDPVSQCPSKMLVLRRKPCG